MCVDFAGTAKAAAKPSRRLIESIDVAPFTVAKGSNGRQYLRSYDVLLGLLL
jgi:hypothetical protein